MIEEERGRVGREGKMERGRVGREGKRKEGYGEREGVEREEERGVQVGRIEKRRTHRNRYIQLPLSPLLSLIAPSGGHHLVWGGGRCGSIFLPITIPL